MRYQLVDVRRDIEEDVEFGTCEWCMSVGTLEYAVAVVKDENGHVSEFENGFFEWGSWYEYSYDEIENVIDFASWFSKQDLSPELDAQGFWGLVDKYNEEKGEK